MENYRISLVRKQLTAPIEVCIVAAGRSPVDRYLNQLQRVSATRLASDCLKGTLEKHSIDPKAVDSVFLGCVYQANLGQNPPRQVAVGAGLSKDVVTQCVNKLCASGMKAIQLGALSVAQGDCEVCVAGGVESMSNYPYIHTKIRDGLVRGNHSVKDSIDLDVLPDPVLRMVPPEASDNVARILGISRSDMDSYSILSSQRAKKAWETGKFNREVIPNAIKKDFIKGGEHIKKLNSLLKGGITTAGNTCGLNDGSSFVVLCSRRKAQEKGWKVLGSIMSIGDVEINGREFPMSTPLAIQKALEYTNLSIEDIDFFEINEPFATVPLGTSKVLGVDLAKINVYGGAVSLGHPEGSSGCRILVTLMSVLEQENGRIGAAAICNAGGGGSALIIRKE